MKPFSIWLVITLLIFGVMSGVYHIYLENNPRRILVAIDSSFPMKSVWHRVPGKLEEIDDQRYTMYSLVTEKNSIHNWKPQLHLGKVVPYAPRDFTNLADNSQYPEIDMADKRYLVTNTEGAQEANLRGWTIIRLTP